MKQIYADFNNFAADGTLPLTCQGSVASIATLDEPLREGEEVWLSDGELRVRAQVFHHHDGSWEGRSYWQFLRGDPWPGEIPCPMAQLETIPAFAWQDLHDATLDRLELHWKTGEAVLHVRTGLAAHPRVEVVGTAVQRVACDRRLPWGPSASINRVRGPIAMADGQGQRLEIEMQSGDILVLEATDVAVRDAK
jgi:hypothetical protein